LEGNTVGLLRRSLNDLLRVDVNAEALARLAWRDFGNGLSMCRLAREGARELVLYRIREGAAPDAFVKHEHIGGEFYLVLKGKIADETGEYEAGDLVFLDPRSVHAPRAIGDTLVLVWPDGVRSRLSGRALLDTYLRSSQRGLEDLNTLIYGTGGRAAAWRNLLKADKLVVNDLRREQARADWRVKGRCSRKRPSRPSPARWCRRCSHNRAVQAVGLGQGGLHEATRGASLGDLQHR
jgi:hypothetical protein